MPAPPFYWSVTVAFLKVTNRSTVVRRTAGPRETTPQRRVTEYFEAAERARRLDVLQRAEREFDPVPFDADAARAYGRVTAAMITAGRKPRRRAVDLIAATAIAAELPVHDKPWRFRKPGSPCHGDPRNRAGSPRRTLTRPMQAQP
jgi:predicted nucleic acid-binding protein